jgi:hypothetical protein
MQKLVYALATIGFILFAVSAYLFPTGHPTSAFWLLFIGVVACVLSVFLHSMDNPIETNSVLDLPIAPVAYQQQVPVRERKPVPVREPRPTQRSGQRETHEPSELEKQVLWFLFQPNVDCALDSITDALRFRYPEETKHYLETLAIQGYVRVPSGWVLGTPFPQYALTPLGREYVVNNLLSSRNDI